MTVIPLSEGAFSIDRSKVFLPFDKAKDNLQERPVGSILVEVQPFVVVTDKDIILLDAGLGFTANDGILQIHRNLLDNDINPLDITKVLVSHLHKDHSGGLCVEDKILERQFLSFPNADYYVNKDEYDYAIAKGAPSYTPAEFALLGNSDKVHFTKGSGNIDGYIKYETCGAHTPYHQVFWIEDGDDKIFFGADVAPQHQQMISRFAAKYDYDGQLCMELRQQWWERGNNEGWTFLFYHDTVKAVAVGERKK